jgi:hypothetical protein
MSHTYSNPELPLDSTNQVVSGDMIFPSGEGNFFDFTQHHDVNNGSGINYKFPSPDDFANISGVLKTRGPDNYDKTKTSGIFNWEGLRQVSDFSNSPSGAPEVPDVTFYPYIHYLPDHPDHDKDKNKIEKKKPVEIPYLSDVKSRTVSELKPPYQYSEDGLFAIYKFLTPYTKGSCTFPDGTCRNNMTLDECTAYPGAIYNEEPCEGN